MVDSFNVIVGILVYSITVCNRIQTVEAANSFQPIYNQDEMLRNAKSSEMLRPMNLDADPCDDFYEYACGNFGQTGGSKKDATTESLIDAKISADLHKLLEEQVTLEDDTTARKVKEFYTSCLGAKHNGNAQQAYFSEFIKANGGFPAVPGSNWQQHFEHQYNWQQVVSQLRYRYNMDILLGLVVDVNYQNLHENSIYLTAPSTLIPRPHLCSTEGTKRVDITDNMYEKLEREVAERLKQWLSLKPSVAKELAADIISFEFELCTAIQEGEEETNMLGIQHANYTRKTLTEFTHDFDDIIDFNQFVSISFNLPVYKPVFMHPNSEKYFTQLIKTIEQHPIATVANYIMFRALSVLAFPLNDHPSRRPKHCVELIKRSFPKILGEMYYRKYGNSNAKADVDGIYAKIALAFEESLNADWIEEGTSRIGKQKLKDIKLVFPSYDQKVSLNNIQIERFNYWRNLDLVLNLDRPRILERLYENGVPKPRFQVESYEQSLQYSPLQLQLDMGWGALQAPFYQTFYPYALKYALVGVKLARELSLAFNAIGWSSDRTGISNWDSYTAQQYENRTNCFRQQLSNYLVNNPLQYSNNSELSELMASSSGVNVAFNAYLSWLSYMSPNNDHATLARETLPEMNLTNTQLFFVAFAQIHCQRSQQPRKRTPAFWPMQLHTVERYKVNGPLRNCVEFARDFKCTPGSEMHPVDKCLIY